MCVLPGGGVAQLLKRRIWCTANACSTPQYAKGILSQSQLPVQTLLVLWCTYSDPSLFPVESHALI